ncbi:unnamed protein product [Adineta steineri]|uniref:Inosine/uridine-preferring nucleoside hydrolase domain-containing protein n=1 Tax=Adineta steineri TaxID=433720 RepID=A0A813VS96_9BILA|nr:unnamed protein product [Adineta steineri]
MIAFCYLIFCFLIFVPTPTKTTDKVIIDNDWNGSASFIPVLLLLDAAAEILGITVVTGDSWVDQETLHVLRFLELGNLTKIPVYKGATYPLLNTPFRTNTWEIMHGKIPYKGAFEEQNVTAEAEGTDPTGGNPTRIVLSALPEGLPTTTTAQDMHAANFLIEQVHTYPNQVSILALGPLTNIALAIKLNSTFASNVKEIFVQAGFFDKNLAQVTGSVLQADLNSDFNLLFDPEAASIVLTADFPSIVLVGQGAQMATFNSSYIDNITSIVTPYTTLIAKYYPTEFPMWDEAATAVLIHSNLITNAVSAFADIDIAYGSPSYGTVHLWQKLLAPVYVRNVSFIQAIDTTEFFNLVRQAVQKTY